MVFRQPDGAETLTKSGRDMPREQNDDWEAVLPAADDAPVRLGATVPASAGLLTVSITAILPYNYDNAAIGIKIYLH